MYYEWRRNQAKWNLIITLTIILIANVAFVVINHDHAIASNPKAHLCFWKLSYKSDKIIDNSNVTGTPGYPTVTLSKGDSVTTSNCPAMYLVGSNREWIAPNLANNQFGDGTFTAGQEILVGKYDTALPEDKEIVCSHNTSVDVPGGNIYTTNIVCAPKALSYLTRQ